ncbi:hypothetical protein P280DRAFT_139978 [Massarina eburnea CBS 473.64]|uniref:Uncharacterized protein n=1 Tax=Massarina eburnea CBS 473.64 TaxID=1395130 RepID=A0A6A6RNI9_9PLEO|nr:hypothetical protein P280DRAFT_139978 [Massarina eburnea CBS 473.64]
MSVLLEGNVFFNLQSSAFNLQPSTPGNVSLIPHVRYVSSARYLDVAASSCRTMARRSCDVQVTNFALVVFISLEIPSFRPRLASIVLPLVASRRGQFPRTICVRDVFGQQVRPPRTIPCTTASGGPIADLASTSRAWCRRCPSNTLAGSGIRVLGTGLLNNSILPADHVPFVRCLDARMSHSGPGFP